jgi:putative membrane protein
MHYLDVHVLYIMLPMVFAVRYAFDRAPTIWRRHGTQSLVLLAVLATIWTTPWDNLMLYHGVWSYPPDAVLGTILYVPIEEHLFFLFQPVLTGAVTIWALRNFDELPSEPSWLVRTLGFWAGFGLFALGFKLLDDPSGYYLGSTLLWFSPVLMLQWWVGADRLLPRLRLLGGVVLSCTLYLSLVDGIAMRSKVWAISKAHTLGPAVGNVPLEEIMFFFITNVLVVTGVTLYIDLARGWKWAD